MLRHTHTALSALVGQCCCVSMLDHRSEAHSVAVLGHIQDAAVCVGSVCCAKHMAIRTCVSLVCCVARTVARMGVQVAIKTFNDGIMSTDGFLQEMAVLAKLRHPHLLELYCMVGVFL